MPLNKPTTDTIDSIISVFEDFCDQYHKSNPKKPMPEAAMAILTAFSLLEINKGERENIDHFIQIALRGAEYLNRLA